METHGNGVEKEVDEEERQDNIACCVAALGEQCRTNRDDSVGNQLPSTGDQPHWATTRALAQQSTKHGGKPVPHLEASVVDHLICRIDDADREENGHEVKGDDAVADHLHAQAASDDNEKTVPVALGSEEAAVLDGLCQPLNLQCGPDLLEFVLYQFVVHITVGVELGDDTVGLLHATVTGEPARRLGAERHEGKTENGCPHLKEQWETPAPLAFDVPAGVADPTANHGTEELTGLDKSGALSAVARVCNLGRVGAAGKGGEAREDTVEEASAKVLPGAKGKAQKDRGTEKTDVTDDHEKLAAPTVGDESARNEAWKCAERVGSNNATDDSGGGSAKCNPEERVGLEVDDDGRVIT